MIDYLIKLWTKPRLQLSAADELAMVVSVLLAFVILFGLYAGGMAVIKGRK